MVVNGLNTKYASGSIIEGNSKARAQAGQSLLEFVLMLPVIFGLANVIYRANMAIQQSIVNQQYARQQTLIITEHSKSSINLLISSKIILSLKVNFSIF